MIDRRTALELAALGVAANRLRAAEKHMHTLKTKPGAYKLRFFTEAENQLLDRVAEMIIPADMRSPGAHEARVSYHIDLVAAHSPRAVQQRWKAQLAAFDRIGARPFMDLPPEGQTSVLNQAAANETRPATEAERFFVAVKRAVVFAYYTSEIGMLKELRYQGNRVLAGFPGCQHPAGKHG